MLISRVIYIENASFASFRSRLSISFGGQRKKRKFRREDSGYKWADINRADGRTWALDMTCILRIPVIYVIELQHIIINK